MTEQADYALVGAGIAGPLDLFGLEAPGLTCSLAIAIMSPTYCAGHSR